MVNTNLSLLNLESGLDFEFFSGYIPEQSFVGPIAIPICGGDVLHLPHPFPP